jgi:tRNA(fMet)-specific endonuclease VapC
MPIRYLLDTNTVSHILKGDIPRVRKCLLKVPMSEVAISVVTEAELRFGVARRPEATRLQIAVDEFLLRLGCLPWDSTVAQQYAHLRAALERDGEPMGNLDMMIAAHALAIPAVLVSSDHVFRRVKQLKTQDWAKA